MANQAMTQAYGYQCPVRGCDKKHNRRFSLMGLVMHMMDKHGDDEVAKRLRAKKLYRTIVDGHGGGPG